MLFSCDEGQGGWLRYAPMREYRLPEIVSIDEVVRVNRDEPRSSELYYLKWPGMGVPHDDPLSCTIPAAVSNGWLSAAAKPEQKDRSLRALLAAGAVPCAAPIEVAYHVAVNACRIRYTEDGKAAWLHDDIPLAVAGMPPEATRYVLDKVFALDGEHVAAARYLKWMAETHRDHPLLRGFDTMIREELMDVSTRCAQLFFMLLGDCMWDRDQDYFSRDENRFSWGAMAGYLHFAGRVGNGRIPDQSGIDQWRRYPKRAFPGVLEALDAWDWDGCREASRTPGASEHAAKRSKHRRLR